MLIMSLSHFDERSGIIFCPTPWGRWWQTVNEVHLEINLPKNTRSRDLNIVITATSIECKLLNKILLKGTLFHVIHPSDSVWTLEDNCLLQILLSKADYSGKEFIWEALLADGTFAPDFLTLSEIRKKIDLEKFQLKYPGLDFSHASLQKSYDDIQNRTSPN